MGDKVVFTYTSTELPPPPNGKAQRTGHGPPSANEGESDARGRVRCSAWLGAAPTHAMAELTDASDDHQGRGIRPTPDSIASADDRRKPILMTRLTTRFSGRA